MPRWTSVSIKGSHGRFVYYVEAEEDAIVRGCFARPAAQTPGGWPHDQRRDRDTLLRRAAAEIREYFEDKRRTFTVPFVLDGTEFQCRVWEALWRIPFGAIKTYTEIAREVGRPGASRAVGQANGSNPLPIIVPCHRVVSSDGALGGYAGGLDLKRVLLRLEGLDPSKTAEQLHLQL
jgi:methylated-DNA-[protein]-cysteine S-methyltransferase